MRPTFLRKGNAVCRKPLLEASIAAALILLSSCLWAQQTTDILDLRQAIARTLLTNPDLIAEGHQLRAQEGRIIQAGVKPAPELIIMVENILGSGENNMLAGAQTTVSIAWILDHGLSETRVAAESATRDLMQVDVEVSRLDAAAETARLYLNCLALQTEMVNAIAAITQAKATVEAVSARVDAGAVPSAELARARAELATRELLREDIEHETTAAYHLLSERWGLTTPDFATVTGNVLTLPQLQDFDRLKARVAQNPNIARFLSQQRMYDAQLRLAETSRKGNWRISAGVRQMETTGDQAFVVDVNLPLAKRDSIRGRLEEARANLARTEAEETAERVHVETQLYVMYLQMQHYLAVSAALRDNIIPLHEAALAETQNAYEQGRYSYQELSTVQSDLLAARNELVDNSIQAHRRLIEIERFTGVTIETSQP
jgi:cobalt-zinc-cadmium efflux system outer membrane protein